MKPKVVKGIEWCDRCDGCGWYEGGKTLQTTCEKCRGTGRVRVEVESVTKPKKPKVVKLVATIRYEVRSEGVGRFVSLKDEGKYLAALFTMGKRKVTVRKR